MLTFLREPRVAVRVAATFSEAFATIRPAVEAMNRQLDMAISLGVLARRCNLSPAQFRRVFHRALGCPPRTYLQRLRLSEAKRRLITGQDTVETIAQAIGYSTTSFFNAVFKRETGMRPGDYRQMGANQSSADASVERPAP
jgi:AraC-like DNA-binding protein